MGSVPCNTWGYWESDYRSPNLRAHGLEPLSVEWPEGHPSYSQGYALARAAGSLRHFKAASLYHLTTRQKIQVVMAEHPPAPHQRMSITDPGPAIPSGPEPDA